MHRACCCFVFLTLLLGSQHGAAVSAADDAPLLVVVMDPLAAPLACDCVQGYAQRKYEVLGEYLTKQLGRPVEVVWGESIMKALDGKKGATPHLVIGKDSVVRADGIKHKHVLQPIARLTDKQGQTVQKGLFVVDARDAAASLLDLEDYEIRFGFSDAEEKHGAAKEYLDDLGVKFTSHEADCESCSVAAKDLLAAGPNQKKAAIISSYAAPLLEGCGSIQKGDLRVVGETPAVPFVSVFVNEAVGAELKELLVAELIQAKSADLLAALESSKGFVPYGDDPAKQGAAPKSNDTGSLSDSTNSQANNIWPGWRGTHGDGHVSRLPRSLNGVTKRWSFKLPGEGIGGVAATDQFVIVSSRNGADSHDLFFSLDPETGVELWSYSYEAPGSLDYGPSPRATPLICDPYVITLGAFGNLACLDIDTGEPLWTRNLVRDFQGMLPTWGFCCSPVLLDGQLIVMPGGAATTVVALDLETGDLVWRGSGTKVGYSAPVIRRDADHTDIIGYEQNRLTAWDARTGEVRWSLKPSWKGDFNVPTPLLAGNRLILSTENNGTRLYEFHANGELALDAKAVNEDLAPDTHSPIVIGDIVLGVQGSLIALSANEGLRQLWSLDDKIFTSHCSLMADDSHLLVVSENSDVLLLSIDQQGARKLGQFRANPQARSMLAHPAIAGQTLFLRSADSLDAWSMPN
jgi:outer membrane protein assembly factor BamB